MSFAMNKKTQLALKQALVRLSTHRGSENTQLLQGHKASNLWRNRFFATFLVFPTVAGIIYFGFVASDRYVSETAFVVKSSKQIAAPNGFFTLLRMVGGNDAQDDAFAVHEFMTSRDAIMQLSAQIDLKAIFGSRSVDRLSRFPNLLHADSIDEFERYFKSRVSVVYNPNTGISKLSVQAFKPEESVIVAKSLIQLSEQFVNKMNGRIHFDMVQLANDEVQRAQSNLKKAQLQITMFRNREIQIDPNKSSFLVMDIVAKLSEELSIAQLRSKELESASPNSPELQGIRRRINVLREEIANERRRMTDGSDGLAQKIGEYDALLLEREFAARALGIAISSLEAAAVEARRKQFYLELVAGPSLPDRALMPERIENIFSIFAINMVTLLVSWLLITGVRERAAAIRDDER